MILLFNAYSSTPAAFKLLLFFGLIFVFLVAFKMAAKSRQYIAKTDHLLCKSCGTSHPPFAHFCRRCGKNLLA